MSVFGDSFDLRSRILGFLGLIEVDTPDGTYRFMAGVNGVFRDIEGREWVGSQLLQGNELEWSRNGEAPEGMIGLSYFQDPDAPDLITEVRALGADYLAGRQFRFYVQPLRSMEDFYAPALPMLLIATRRAGSITYDLQGDIVRRITISIEGPMSARRAARVRFYTVEDHARLVGADNPSLEFMPYEPREEEALFG